MYLCMYLYVYMCAYNIYVYMCEYNIYMYIYILYSHIHTMCAYNICIGAYIIMCIPTLVHNFWERSMHIQIESPTLNKHIAAVIPFLSNPHQAQTAAMHKQFFNVANCFLILVSPWSADRREPCTQTGVLRQFA